jgi:hypothetical protein
VRRLGRSRRRHVRRRLVHDAALGEARRVHLLVNLRLDDALL